jgi:dynein heavy chain 1
VRNGQVPPANFVKAKKLIEEEGLTFEMLKPKSEAAATFIDFALNIIEFAEVMAMVGPMEAELGELTVKLNEANETARVSQEKVDKLNAMLKELIDKYDLVNNEKQGAMAEAKKYEDKSNMATRLINALKAEYDRWKDSIAVQESKLVVVCGDVLLSAAFIS